MALDGIAQVDWKQRLQRESMDGCLIGVERARVRIGSQERVVYVGGIFQNLLWTSGEINKEAHNYLEPSISRICIDIIEDYQVIN